MKNTIAVLVSAFVALIATFVAIMTKGLKKTTSASGRKYTRFHYNAPLGAAMQKVLTIGGHGMVGTPALFYLSHKGEMTVVIFDGLMQRLTPLTQAFVYLHEEGHVDDTALMEHLGTVKIEVTADRYAIEKLGLGVEDIHHVFDDLLRFVKEVNSPTMNEVIDQVLYRKETALARLQA